MTRGEAEARLAGAIGQLGVWDAGLCFAPAAQARAAAAELEEAGYGAAWLHEGGADAFVLAGALLGATERLAVGTSIVSIWNHEPGRMAAAARSLGEAYPGRFVLGIGPAHHGARNWSGRGYDRPVADVSEYLDAMDRASYSGPRPAPPVPRVLAALGPRMLDLARRRARGAIPYLVPVEHTRLAREALGPGPVLAVQQAIVLEERPARAVELAERHVGRYLESVNYPANLRRCGFSDDDLDGSGSRRLIEALVAMGDVDEVAARVQAHLEAGADHVCVEPLGRAHDATPLTLLGQLAAALGPELVPA